MTDAKTKDEFSLEEDDLFEDFDIVGTINVGLVMTWAVFHIVVEYTWLLC
jgi:hypothetical protein